MTGFFLAFLLIIPVTMLLIETVTVRVIYRDELVIRVVFLVFELILYPSRNRKPRKKEKGRIIRIRKGLASSYATKRALEHLFSRSRVTVNEIDIAERKTKDPAQLAIATQRSRNIITVILAYLSFKSEALVAPKAQLIISDEATHSPLTVDVSLSSTLLGVISSLVIYFKNAKGYKRKRGRRIV